VTRDQAKTRINRARRQRGLSQEELARLLGSSWVTVCRWERGKRYPAPEFWESIRKVLGLVMDDEEI